MKTIIAAVSLLLFTYCNATKIKCYSCHRIDLGLIGTIAGLKTPSTVFDLLKRNEIIALRGDERDPIIDNAFCKNPIEGSNTKETDTTEESCFIAQVNPGMGVKLTIRNGYEKDNCKLIRSLVEEIIPNIVKELVESLVKAWPDINIKITQFLNQFVEIVPEKILNKHKNLPKRPFKAKDILTILALLPEIMKDLSPNEVKVLSKKMVNLLGMILLQLMDLKKVVGELPTLLVFPPEMQKQIGELVFYASSPTGKEVPELLKKIKVLYFKINNLLPKIGVDDITELPMKNIEIKTDCEECFEEKCNKVLKTRKPEETEDMPKPGLVNTEKSTAGEPEKPNQPKNEIIEEKVKTITPSFGVRLKHQTYQIFLILAVAYVIYLS